MTTRRKLITTGIPALLAGGALAPLAMAQQGGGNRPQQQGPLQPRPETGSKLQRVMGAFWDGSQYVLPPLPYDYTALEPHIDEQTMRLHHDKHHQAYVSGLNAAVKALREGARGESEDMARLSGLQRDLSFNWGGHAMHSVFWAMMGPRQGGGMGGEPVGQLQQQIRDGFGSFDNFKRHFINVGKSVKGSGWAVLTYDPSSGQVYVKSMNDQDLYFPPGHTPILPCDVWEHAYYLKYQNQREAYLNAWFNVIDWQTADELYQLCHQMWHG